MSIFIVFLFEQLPFPSPYISLHEFISICPTLFWLILLCLINSCFSVNAAYWYIGSLLQNFLNKIACIFLSNYLLNFFFFVLFRFHLMSWTVTVKFYTRSLLLSGSYFDGFIFNLITEILKRVPRSCFFIWLLLLIKHALWHVIMIHLQLLVFKLCILLNQVNVKNWRQL